MKNKILLKTLSAILAVVMVICSAPLSGFVGLDLSELFSLEGEAYTADNFYYSVYGGEAVLTGCVNAVGDIELPSTIGGYPVTAIGPAAFSHCNNIMSVVIPDGITSISDDAFFSCKNLISVVVPDSVTKIGRVAFDYCTSLVSVEISENVTDIGEYAFANCINLTQIMVDPDNKYYCSDSYGVLYNKDKTNLIQYPVGNSRTTFEIPEDVISIENYAFSGCDSLKSITIPGSISKISSHAFYSCINLTDIFYRGDIESWCNITFVYYYANPMCYAENFYIDDTLVNEILIPNTVSEIKDYAFYNFEKATVVTMPDSVTKIGCSAFDGCINLLSITISNSVENIGSNAFYNTACYNKTSNWKNDVLYIDNHLIKAKTSILGPYTIKSGTKSIADSAFEDCTNLTLITIPDSVVFIGNSAFSGCDGLTSVMVGDAVTNIGGFAFFSCDNLTSVTLGNNVINIGSYAFSLCVELKSVTIPKSVVSIDEYAFDSCNNLRYIVYSGTEEDWLGISVGPGNSFLGGTRIFYETNSLDFKTENNITYAIADTYAKVAFYSGSNSFVTISERIEGKPVVAVCENAFMDGTSIESIIIPDSITEIGGSAFRGCTNLLSVTIPKGVKNIGSSTFRDCTNLKTLIIPDGIVSVGYYAFHNCINLTDVYYKGDLYSWCRIIFNDSTSNPMIYAKNFYINDTVVTEIVIPTMIEKINNYTFCGFEGVKYVKIPDSVTSIGSYSFSNCTNLTTIEIPDTLKSIVYGAFSNCTNLKSFAIPAGVTNIDSLSFSNCTNLTSITIPSSVTEINYGAFENCTNLTAVYYIGTVYDWDNISIDIKNDCLTNSTICFLEDKHDHSYSVDIIKQPTCESIGIKIYVCLCGDNYSEEMSELGHSYGKWKITTDPTITTDGVKVRECFDCDKTEEGIVPKTGITLTLTDSSGNIIGVTVVEGDVMEYSFENLEEGEYTVSISKETYTAREYQTTATDGSVTCAFKLNHVGDINGDGKVNTIDVAHANAHAKGVSALAGYDFDCADINSDGKVNTLDVARMNSHAKGVSSIW